MKHLFVIMLMAGSLFSCKQKNYTEPIETPMDDPGEMSAAQNIAKAQGFDNWDDVHELAFTFHVNRGTRNSRRSWKWFPKSDSVIAMIDSDTIHYNRRHMDSIIQRTDAAFINDKYWLLAPYNLVSDSGTEVTEHGKAVAPISGDTLQKITINYVGDGGYTPGDAYDFYYDADSYIINEWVFRKGNDSLPTLITTREDYQDFNGLKLSTMHQDSLNALKIYFTDIGVKKQ